MGTRCLTIIKRHDGTEIAVMYRQFDGYPDGHGLELAEFLSDLTVVNGITGEAELGRIANGPHCLAAQMIAHFKKEPGGIYLYPAGTRNVGEDYAYTVTVPRPRGEIIVSVDGFTGNVAAFRDWCSQADAEA